MMPNTPSRVLKIATRKSPLALWQAEHIKSVLQHCHPNLSVELLPMSTKGDVILDTPLAKVGGKGLFVKELEVALLEGRADLAVHSMKDVPVAFPDGLGLATICERESPLDAFVSNDYATIDALPQGATVGTCSLRRQCQLKYHRPDLNIVPLRGNVNSRLAKLDDQQFDAILLAVSGLTRLGMAQRIRWEIPPEVSLPAVGQGALGIECRLDDTEVLEWLQPLQHQDSLDRVRAERAMNARLEGGCQVPIGGYAVLEGNELWVRGLVGADDGSQLITAEVRGPRAEAAALGTLLGERLLEQGAAPLLAALYDKS